MGMTRKAAALAVGALLGAALAAGPAAAKDKSNKTDQSRRVCRSVTPVGTRLATRICRPASEWAEMEKAEQDGVLKGQTEGFMVRRDPIPDSTGVIPR